MNPSPVRVEHARFTLSVESVVEHARHMMLSENPAGAYRVLSEGVKGADDMRSLAERVLDGKVTITEDAVVDDNPEKYLRDLRFIYAGRFRYRGRWYRPQAELHGIGEHGEFGAWRRFGPVVTHKGRTFLLESCGELPHWWTPFRDLAAALESFAEQGRHLDHYYTREREERDLAEKQHQEYLRKGAKLRDRILAQNGDEMFPLHDDSGKLVISVPFKPFAAWALERTPFSFRVPWEPVSPSGLKLNGDSRAHSDWILGAGIPIDEIDSGWYEHPVQKAAYNGMLEIQQRFGNVDATILNDGPRSVSGKVGVEIVVLYNLAVENAPKILGAKAVITETGGALAHCTLLARERGIPVLLVRGAVKLFPSGTYVCVDPVRGKITNGV